MLKHIRIVLNLEINPKRLDLFKKLTHHIEYLIPEEDQKILGIHSIYGVEVKEID